MAEEALAGYDEREGALKAAKKKLKALSGLSNNVRRRRLAGALRRRGFSAGTIMETLRAEGVRLMEEERNEE
jgi:SOS response regulatory protein OraA/RecX